MAFHFYILNRTVTTSIVSLNMDTHIFSSPLPHIKHMKLCFCSSGTYSMRMHGRTHHLGNSPKHSVRDIEHSRNPISSGCLTLLARKPQQAPLSDTTLRSMSCVLDQSQTITRCYSLEVWHCDNGCG